MTQSRTTQFTTQLKRIFFLLIVASVVMGASLRVFAEEEKTPETNIAPGNRIWFYDMAGGGFDSDFVIIESQGRWGLIDTGNRYGNKIEDSDGTIYNVSRSDSLSNQSIGRNGRDAATWMVENLGVSHLDFIIGTHAHSDHIGGVPEIAALTFVDDAGEEYHLVDEDTIYIYKAYHHVDAINDDLGDVKRSDSWHNQAFFYQAVKSMSDHGAVTVELSKNLMTSANSQPALNYSNELSQIETSSSINSLFYAQGSLDDWFDDHICFAFGDFTITLYNLFSVDGAVNENVNSIVAVITDGYRKLYTGGDVNVEQEVEQRIARAIADDYGTMDVLKVSHHGLAKSTSKELLDLLQPRSGIITSAKKSTEGPFNTYMVSPAIYYGKNTYGIDFYMVAASDKALVYDFSDDGIYQVIGDKDVYYMASSESCINRQTFYGGWKQWIQNVEEGVVTAAEYYYFENGAAKSGWIRSNGRYYYMNPESGLMARGWLELDDEKYYLATETGDGLSDGQMLTGIHEIDGVTYAFRGNGALAEGWVKKGDSWYYAGEDGVLVTGWQEIDDKWYYLDDDYSMKTGWIFEKPNAPGEKTVRYHLHETRGDAAVGWRKIDDNWYYFGSDRKLVTGWIEDNGKRYYLDDNGTMVNGWKKIDDRWYYFGVEGKPESGALRTEWVKDSGKWYYMGQDGIMMRGLQEIGGRKYYLGYDSDPDSGAMRRGWVKQEDEWYYFGYMGDPDSGAMRFGWIEDGKTWYYLDEEGVMASDEFINGWWLNKNGSWTYPYRSSWSKSKNKWFFGDESGWFAKNKEYKINGVEYAFDKEGWMIEPEPEEETVK